MVALFYKAGQRIKVVCQHLPFKYLYAIINTTTN